MKFQNSNLNPIILLFFIIFFISFSNQLSFPSIKSQLSDVPYSVINNLKYGNDQLQTFDLYYPKNNSRNDYGGILLIHGGAWVSGDKKDVESFVDSYAKRGYIVANMNYRLVKINSTNITFVSQIEDIILAIKKMTQFTLNMRYPLYGLGLAGFSAGGHLAMIMGYACQSYSVLPLKFIVDLSGPSDFHEESFAGSTLGISGPQLALIINGITKKPEDIPRDELEKLILKTSPIHYIKSSSLPTICGYGAKDDAVPVKGHEAMKNALVKAGIVYDFFTFPNSGHTLQDDPEIMEKLKNKMIEYCVKHFGY